MLVNHEIIRSTISEKIKEMHGEQFKQFAAKIEPKLDTYLRDESDKTFVKMFLVSDIHHQAKNIIQYMLEKRNYVNLNI